MNIDKIRAEFPILDQKVNGKPLVYFDNAATNQKPLAVINALETYYSNANANVHRGIHTLAERATAQYEATRETVRAFIGASSTEEIIFTSGTTQSINLVAQAYGNAFLKAGDGVLISGLEHHSNIVPWQMLCERTGAVLKVIPVLDNGDLDQKAYANLLTENVKLVAFNMVSNSLGTINPAKQMIAQAHQAGAVVLLDGAQATAHVEVDVQDLNCDFFAFSAHKIFGPTGVGVLYGKKDLLNAMPPYMGGGEMIKEVSFEKTTYNELPYKFEAGTPNIGDVVAFKAALDYVNELGKVNIAEYEHELLEYATTKLKAVPGLKIIGEAKEKISVISFIIEGVHHQDLGVLLDNMGVAVRTGHHCTQPLMQRFGILGTTRASFSVYNTKAEIDQMVLAIEKALKMLL